MFYGCWASRSYPKWFCKDNFHLIRTVRSGGAMPANLTFYHWRRTRDSDIIYEAESGDVVLMYIKNRYKPDKYDDSSEIHFYETDVPFFRKWIGGAAFHNEMSVKDWRVLDKWCFEIENPNEEY